LHGGVSNLPQRARERFKSAPSVSTSIRAATLGETAPLRLMNTVGATLNSDGSV
jgi:hypothetical protein